jgi:hypothetical protein
MIVMIMGGRCTFLRTVSNGSLCLVWALLNFWALLSECYFRVT